MYVWHISLTGRLTGSLVTSPIFKCSRTHSREYGLASRAELPPMPSWNVNSFGHRVLVVEPTSNNTSDVMKELVYKTVSAMLKNGVSEEAV